MQENPYTSPRVAQDPKPPTRLAPLQPMPWSWIILLIVGTILLPIGAFLVLAAIG
jgi:hypothetical protein